jgi:hypothetical protein
MFCVPSDGGRALRALAFRATRWRTGGGGGLGAARIRALGRPMAGRQCVGDGAFR